MIGQQETACVDLDTTRSLSVVLRPHEPERTLREFKDFISNENFAESALGSGGEMQQIWWMRSIRSVTVVSWILSPT